MMTTHSGKGTRPDLTPEELHIRQVAAQIANALGETAQEPRHQCTRVVRTLGEERARQFLAEAQRIEQGEGMLTTDGARRRTLGGVFFKLVRDGVTQQERWRIFPTAPTKPRQAEAQRPAVTSSPIVTDLPNLRGVASNMKTTIVGRPGRIIAKQGYIMTTMEARPAQALPKGLPTPPAKPTSVVVYISVKQWQKVAEALRDPEDILIAEGSAVYDADLEGVALYVQKASTRNLDRAAREA